MSWTPLGIEWKEDAFGDLARLEKKLVARIVAAVERYATTGYGDVKRLQGVDREWRLRVGDFRVRFTIDGAIHVMLVLRVLPRGGAYR